MRSLGLPFVLFLFFFKSAFADVQSLALSGFTDHVRGTSDPGNLLGQTATSRNQESLLYKLEGYHSAYSAVAGFTVSEPDYSSYLVQIGSDQVPLSTLPAGNGHLEYSSTLGLGWDSGPHSASVSWVGNLNSSPFGVQALNLAYREGFYSKTTVIGFRLNLAILDQPESNYIDSDFVTQMRPTLIHDNAEILEWDQILAERWKAGLELSTEDRQEDRPRNVGVALRQSYAFWDRLFGQLLLARISELRAEPLKDERGYFDLTSAEVQVTYEPWVDFLASLSYGYVVEGENDPRSGLTLQVGSDQYGLGLKFRRGGWGVESKLGYRVTNTSLQEWNWGGALTWWI